MEAPKSNLLSQIEQEIQTYLSGQVQISEGNNFSQAKLVRRITLFENHIYPSGKFDSQGNYKYWFDIQSPRIDAEVKNTDIDTKNIRPMSDRVKDTFAVLLIGLGLKKFLKDTGQAEELNSAREEGAGWGNVVWKKVKNGYERADLKNLYVINQTAKDLNQSPVIERHQLSQSDIKKNGTNWKNVKEVLKECKSNSYTPTPETTSTETTVPYYLIFERNGEVCLKDIKLEKGEKVLEGDEDKFVLAKVIAAGTSESITGVSLKYLMFADTITEMPYEEYHRSRYKGKWWREGIIELLFDIQVRANKIGNEIAQGLEWASKQIFVSQDKLVIQNIKDDLKNGDVIRSAGLSQLNVRMEGLDQLIAEWNRLMQMANDICNSQEVVQGITPPSGTPLGTTQMLNINSNKLFDFIREKFGIPISRIFERWIISDLIDDMKLKDVMSLTGDTEALDKVRQYIVDDWYLNNLINIGPHTPQIAEALKAGQMEELKKKPQLIVSGLKEVLKDCKNHIYIDITGEQSTNIEDSQTLAQLIGLEPDALRRSKMLEDVLRKKGFDVGSYPQAQPPVQGRVATPQ